MILSHQGGPPRIDPGATVASTAEITRRLSTTLAGHAGGAPA